MNKLLCSMAMVISIFIMLVIVPSVLADNFNLNADYSLEIFTTATPFDEGSSYPLATKLFSNGDDIYLVARYYTKVSGTVGHYLIVTNSAGQVVDFSFYEIYRDVNPHSLYFKRSYPAGSYSFNMVILGPGGKVMSPNSFSFMVVND